MTEISDLHFSIESNSGETKQQGLISELLRVIRTELREGDSLPSVNTLSRELSISRDTVFKAYSMLKKKNIIKSTPTKGYFVSHEINHVLLVLDYYSPFKDQVYQEIMKILDNSYLVDLVFHHYNQKLFDTVILNSIGKYDVFIIMNFDTQEFVISESLIKIEPAKLLLLDIPVENWKECGKRKYSYVWQDFNQAVFEALQSISDLIGKYHDFIMINPERLKHPAVTLQAFSRYCIEHNIKAHVTRFSSEFEIKKGVAYFVLRQNELTAILRLCKEKGLEVGTDIGILAYNDNPLYEFVDSGITVISTDFREIGRLAGKFIIDREPVQKVVPTSVIIRNSL
jgi:DNA-binding LacI/PurR family transcriptional regulator